MEGNILFNDALNTFYLRLYGVDSSEREVGREGVCVCVCERREREREREERGERERERERERAALIKYNEYYVIPGFSDTTVYERYVLSR